MNLKKLGKALICPPIAILIALLPIATVLLVASMVFVGSQTPTSYLSYALAAYTLTVWCVRLPDLIRLLKAFKSENAFAKLWQNDAGLRVKVSLYGSFFWNIAYALFQVWLGFYHHTFWFFSLGSYYLFLALMRFFLLSHSRKYAPGENLEREFRQYRFCGWILLLMNTALSVIVFFMIYWNRTFEHHEITTIALAAYTFTMLTAAIINMVKYRKYQSPVFSAAKAISLVAAIVSMLTLESTMLTTFGGDGMSELEQKIMLGSTGAVISFAIVAMAIYMIVMGTKKLKQLQQEVENGKQ